MTKLLMLRHGESEWNAAGRWQGWSDPPLSDLGRKQAALAAALLDGPVDACVSSDLQRAAETADIVAAHLGLREVMRDEGFREIHVGRWSGLTHAEIDERFPGSLTSWRAGTLERPEGGESRAEFEQRILEAIGRVAERHPSGTIVVCTHGGVIRQMERYTGVFDDQRVGNLDGRWFEAGSHGLRGGDRFDFERLRQG